MRAIVLGYVLIAFGTIGLGYTVVVGLKHLTQLSSDLYDHPFKISQAAFRASLMATAIRTAMLEIGLTNYPEQIKILSEKIDVLDSSIRNEMTFLKSEFLSEHSDIERVTAALDHWSVVRREIINEALSGGPSETVIDVSTGKGAQAFGRVNAELKAVVDEAQKKAAALSKEAQSDSSQQINLAMGEMSALLLFIGIIAVIMSRRANALLIEDEKNLNEIAESNEKHRSFYDAALDAIVMADASGAIIGWTGQANRIFGWSEQEVIGRPLHEIIIPKKHRAAHIRGMEHFTATGEAKVLNTRIEIEALHRDGHEFPVELTISSVKMHGRYEFSAFLRDLTEKKAADALIWKQANFDTLTQLPNRHLFHDRLTQEIRQTESQRKFLALLLIDLDRFKDVNDTLGHRVGDGLIKMVANRLIGCLSGKDYVYRLGGDEFAVIVSDLSAINTVDQLAQSILHELAKPYSLRDELVYVTASIGVAVYPTDCDSSDDLIKKADQAMYAAKDNGRNRYTYFTKFLEDAAQIRKQLATDLRHALAHEQLEIFYQPIVELSNGQIYKAEALLRWRHPERGMISPAAFIPIAEETGVIIEIGEWVCRKSAEQCRAWRNALHPKFAISINKSPVQFHHSDRASTPWSVSLDAIGLPGDGLVIEITEGLLISAEEPNVRAKLQDFAAAGVSLSLDDFGTGYSSLSYLHKFDFDYLKIDQSFVRNMGAGTNALAMCESIIVMAHKLGIKVIAEGIETPEQRDLLRNAGCGFGQGYLWSKPVRSAEFAEFVASWNNMNGLGELSGATGR